MHVLGLQGPLLQDGCLEHFNTTNGENFLPEVCHLSSIAVLYVLYTPPEELAPIYHHESL